MLRILSLLCLAAGVLLQFNFSLSKENCNDNSIRLVGGPNKFEGRIEICLGGVWGQVCGTGWDDTKRFAATLVCQNLGHLSAFTANTSTPRIFGWTRSGNIYGKGEGPAFIDNITGCPGVSDRLFNCDYTSINITNGCPNNLTAGVVCPDTQCQNQVINSTDSGQLEACLEICQFGTTKTFVRAGVCSHNWDNSDARVLCKQLRNDSSEDTARAMLGPKSNYGFIVNSSIDCLGNESNFSECFSSKPLLYMEHLNEDDGCTLAEVQCLSELITTSPVPEATVIMTRPTLLPPPVAMTTSTSTTQPSASPNTINYILIAIGVGILVLLVLILLMMLTCIICIVKRKHPRKKSATMGQNMYTDSRPDSCEYDDTLPVGITNGQTNDILVTAAAGSSLLTENSSHEEPEKILLNPLYRKTTTETGYAKILTREASPYYSTPIPLPHPPHSEPVVNPIRGPNGAVLESKPIVDVQGYASLEKPYHCYSQPTPDPSPHPYEVPVSPQSGVTTFKSDSQLPHEYI